MKPIPSSPAAQLVCLLLATSTSALAAGPYEVTNLGTLGGSFCSGFHGQSSYATALNDNGQVTGASCRFVGFFQPVIHGFTYTGGVMVDVGTLGPDQSITIARGINYSGYVVGASGVSGGGPDTGGRAFLYGGGGLTDLGVHFIGFSQATDINDAGLVVGYASPGRFDSWSAFSYQDGSVTDLGTLGGTFRSAALAVNNVGQIVGYASTAGDVSFHAFLYDGGAMRDLGTLGGRHSFATGINNRGVVVGHSYMRGDASEHAFVYASASMTDLGTLGGVSSSAMGINDAGVIVGAASTSTGSYHAFLYEAGTMHDLNDLIPATPAVVLTEANSINNAGEIAATGIIHGEQRAFLLTLPNGPPDCGGAAVNTAWIWPPNHRFVPVAIDSVTDPDGDPVTITVTGITQDEMVGGDANSMRENPWAEELSSLDPLIAHSGAGATCPDGRIVDGKAYVNAERSGNGNGRVYSISFTAADSRGGTCSGTVSVCVPHDLGAGRTCIDDGQLFNSLAGSSSGARGLGPASGPRLLVPVAKNEVAILEYALAQGGEVDLAVYDLAGRRVATIEHRMRAAGNHRVSWNATGSPSGVYFVRLQTESLSVKRPLIVVR